MFLFGDIVFKRSKTGPLPFNVEYTLKALACKPRSLSEEERALIAAEKSIDEKYVRPTVDEVVKLLERITKGGSEEEVPTNTDGEAVNELG